MSPKKIKLFEYLKSYVRRNVFVFLREIHSSMSYDKKWDNEFNFKLFSLMESKSLAKLIKNVTTPGGFTY